MKLKNGKRVAALVMSLLMIIGIMPLENLLAGNAVTAKAAETVSGDSWYFNGADLDAAAIAGGLDTKITSDTPIGTNDFFTVVGIEGKNMISQPKELAYGSAAYNQCVYLTGGVQASGKAGIKFTVEAGKTVRLTVLASAKSEGASVLKVRGGSEVAMGDLVYETVNKYTVELGAGTYYLGGSNGAFVYFAEAKYIEKYTMDASTLRTETGVADETKFSADTTVGTAGFFTIKGDANPSNAKNLIKDLSATPVVYGDTTYNDALQLGGALNNTGKAGLGFTVAAGKTATIKVVASAKSTSASLFEYAKDGVLTTIDPLVNEEAKEYTISNVSEGKYWIGGTNGANIYNVEVEYVTAYSLDANDPASLTAAFDGTKGEIQVDTAVGTDNYFGLIAKGQKTKNPVVNYEYNGNTYEKALRLDGGANVNSQACFKINVAETAKVTIIAAGKNDSNSMLEYVKVGGTTFTTFSDAMSKGVVVENILTDLTPGEYYIGATQGVDIISVLVEYDSSTVKAADWNTVETPVINSVTVNEEGNFVVDFTAVIDKVKGAETVNVTMLEGGYEVSTTTVSSQNNSVVMEPLWSGDYTFVATARRTGYADKASEPVAYNGYVMAVRKPVITWAQNKGNGSLYIDWVNIADADSYSIGYKIQGSADDYTMVETELSAEQGDYTITGLTAGSTYDIIVKAKRNSDQFESFYNTTIDVSADADQKWYVATVGSAQTTNAEIVKADGSTDTISLDAGDTSANKQNNVEAADISNTAGTIEIKQSTSGKISDDEDGFSYYYTKVDPDTENFKLSAKFTITEAGSEDNQTGFGVVAADILGINFWGTPDYVHKYFNYASSMLFSSKSSRPVMRNVTGYTAADTSNNDGVERAVTNTSYKNSGTNFAVGTEYTFSLEKTDTGYTATCNGEELSVADNSFTSVQEDGTICVGVMVSRKVSAKISDMTFTKSDSQGITSSGDKDVKITPNATIYSSETCGAGTYTLIYQPNCAGTLKVEGAAGTVLDNKQVEAGEVVRVEVPVAIGANTIVSTLVPAAGDNITSTNAVVKNTSVTRQVYGLEGQTIIVSADGSSTGKGTEESPLDIGTAVKYAQPGQIIFLKDGTYTKGATIKRSVSGTSDKNITMVAETVGGVVFNGAGITVIGDYWHIYGITVKDAAGVGIQISGNYNTIEMCTVNHASNSGFQISRSGSADNKAGIESKLWPTGNLVKNCESFDNCDAGRNDADGFAAKLTCGNDNKFYGCISHNNIDDGWDLYAKSVSGEIGSVVIENCVAYNNGWLSFEDPAVDGYGEGNGFKLGGGYLKGGHVLKNSISFGNHAKGITSNSCPDCQIIDCISYNNSVNSTDAGGAYNIGLNTKASNKKEWVVNGLISLNNKSNTKQTDLIPFALYSANNYIYNGSESYNNQGVQATDSWFENVNISVAPERNADGTINMHGLLQLKESAPADTGARLDVISEEAISVKPEKTTIVGSDPEKPTEPETPTEKPTEPETPTEKPTEPETPTEKPTEPETPTEKPTEPEKPTEKPSEKPTEPTKPDSIIEVIISDDSIINQAIKEVAVDADTKIKDDAGNDVEIADIYIKLGVLDGEAVSEMAKGITNLGVTLSNNTKVTYMDISLMSAGKVVKISNGKIKIKLTPDSTVDLTKYDMKVYHMVNGVVKEEVVYNSANPYIEVDSLSPFAITYVEKVEIPTKADTTNEGTETGDTSRAGVYVFIAILSMAVLVLAYESKKRRIH